MDLTIPRLQTVHYAPVFAAGYDLVTPAEFVIAWGNPLCVQIRPLSSTATNVGKKEDEGFYFSALKNLWEQAGL